jgi:hypothetical protein
MTKHFIARPHFSRADRDDLLKSMGRSLSLSRLYEATKGHNSPQHRMVKSLRDAVKALAADLTDDPDYYGEQDEVQQDEVQKAFD